MSYFVFTMRNKAHKGRSPNSGVVAIKELLTRDQAVSYAQRRCRLTGDDYVVASETAFVAMGPQVISV